MTATAKVLAFNSATYDVIPENTQTVSQAVETVLGQLDLSAHANLFTLAGLTDAHLAAAASGARPQPVLATEAALLLKSLAFGRLVAPREAMAWSPPALCSLLLKRQVFCGVGTTPEPHPRLAELTALQVATDVKHGLYPEPAAAEQLQPLVAAGNYAALLSVAASWETGAALMTPVEVLGADPGSGLPTSAVLGLNERGLHLVDRASRKLVTRLPLQRLVCVAFNGPEEVLAVTSCEGGALMVRLPGPDAWAAAFSALQLAVGTSAQVMVSLGLTATSARSNLVPVPPGPAAGPTPPLTPEAAAAAVAAAAAAAGPLPDPLAVVVGVVEEEEAERAITLTINIKEEEAAALVAAWDAASAAAATAAAAAEAASKAAAGAGPPAAAGTTPPHTGPYPTALADAVRAMSSALSGGVGVQQLTLALNVLSMGGTPATALAAAVTGSSAATAVPGGLKLGQQGGGLNGLAGPAHHSRATTPTSGTTPTSNKGAHGTGHSFGQQQQQGGQQQNQRQGQNQRGRGGFLHPPPGMGPGYGPAVARQPRGRGGQQYGQGYGTGGAMMGPGGHMGGGQQGMGGLQGGSGGGLPVVYHTGGSMSYMTPQGAALPAQPMQAAAAAGGQQYYMVGANGQVYAGVLPAGGGGGYGGQMGGAQPMQQVQQVAAQPMAQMQQGRGQPMYMSQGGQTYAVSYGMTVAQPQQAQQLQVVGQQGMQVLAPGDLATPSGLAALQHQAIAAGTSGAGSGGGGGQQLMMAAPQQQGGGAQQVVLQQQQPAMQQQVAYQMQGGGTYLQVAPSQGHQQVLNVAMTDPSTQAAPGLEGGGGAPGLGGWQGGAGAAYGASGGEAGAMGGLGGGYGDPSAQQQQLGGLHLGDQLLGGGAGGGGAGGAYAAASGGFGALGGGQGAFGGGGYAADQQQVAYDVNGNPTALLNGYGAQPGMG